MWGFKGWNPQRNDSQGLLAPSKKIGYYLSTNDNDFLRKKNDNVGTIKRI